MRNLINSGKSILKGVTENGEVWSQEEVINKEVITTVKTAEAKPETRHDGKHRKWRQEVTESQIEI